MRCLAILRQTTLNLALRNSRGKALIFKIRYSNAPEIRVASQKGQWRRRCSYQLRGVPVADDHRRCGRSRPSSSRSPGGEYSAAFTRSRHSQIIRRRGSTAHYIGHSCRRGVIPKAAVRSWPRQTVRKTEKARRLGGPSYCDNRSNKQGKRELLQTCRNSAEHYRGEISDLLHGQSPFGDNEVKNDVEDAMNNYMKEPNS